MKASDFKPGDAVKITGDGTFAGFTGVVAGSDGMRVLVRILIFGRLTDPMPIRATDLKKRSAKGTG